MEGFLFESNEFNEVFRSNLTKFRSDSDFCDVTLVCEDGQQVEAHKLVLSMLSPVLENILKRNKQHAHPLVYMRGVNSLDLSALLDFSYFGQARVPIENLESFLSIAHELEVAGLSSDEGELSSGGVGLPGGTRLVEQVSSESKNIEEKKMRWTMKIEDEVRVRVKDSEGTRRFNDFDATRSPKELVRSGASAQSSAAKLSNELGMNPSTKVRTDRTNGIIHEDTVTKRQKSELEDSILAEKVNSMMTPSNNRICRKLAYTCKVCGKEARSAHMKLHIRRHHMDDKKILS